jgi:hypothetical protein
MAKVRVRVIEKGAGFAVVMVLRGEETTIITITDPAVLVEVASLNVGETTLIEDLLG